jgi:hypothetical protein
MLIPELWTTPQLLAVGLMCYMAGMTHAIIEQWWYQRRRRDDNV